LLIKELEKKLTANDFPLYDDKILVIYIDKFPFQSSDDLLALFGIRSSKAFSVEQKKELNRFFNEVSQYPSLEQKEYLANMLHLSAKQVSEWFHNKRKRSKK
jgi:hypothetical protein